MKAENENITPLVTIADALDVFSNGKKGWTSKKMNFGNLNFSENKSAFKEIILTGYLLKINDLLVSLPLSKHEVTKIMSDLKNRFFQGLENASSAIINVLDTDVIQIMHDTAFKNIEYIRWLTGGDGESRALIEARQQAIKAYPVLATEIFKSSDLRIVIDARTSLSRAIARKYKTDQHKVKRFHGLTWQQANHGAPYFLGSLSLFEILNMPEGMVPKTPDEFRKIDKMMRFAASLYSDKTSGNKGIKLSIIMNYISRQENFQGLLNKIDQTSSMDVLDAISFLKFKLFIPARLNRIKKNDIRSNDISACPGLLSMERDAKNAILMTFKIRELLDFSDRYHQNIIRYEDRLDTISINMNWPGMMRTYDLGDGYNARELTSSLALKVQGVTEHHCVGGYVSRVVESRSDQATLIFSIENNGKILSTIEIRCRVESVPSGSASWISGSPDSEPVSVLRAEIMQNRTAHNESPSKTVITMADRVVEKLEQAGPVALKTYLDGLAHVRTEMERTSKLDVHVKACAFDPYDKVMLKRVWQELSPALPKCIRKAGLENFIEHGDIYRYSLNFVQDSD